MKDKPLYLSVDISSYKSNRSDMLNSQIDLLNSMKHLHTIKQIKNEKFKLKMRLYALFASLMEDLESLDTKMPNIELPQEKKEKVAPVQKPAKIIDPKRDSIESELKEIQEKLKRLNS